MRLISFAWTSDAFLEGRKTVTRRQGWKTLKAGTRLQVVRKAMGLRKGEKVERLGVIEVLDVSRVPLDSIDLEDVRREAVEGVTTPEDFVRFYALGNRCEPSSLVTRISFRPILRIRRFPRRSS